MPVVFTAKLDGSEAIRYFHVPLTVFYLEQASNHATGAANAPEGESKFKESLLAIVFASLCLEAFANEMAENKYDGKEQKDFFDLKGKYKRKNNQVTSVAWKIKLLFELHWAENLLIEHSPLKEVEELSRLRNALVHYKLGEGSGKAHMPPPETHVVGVTVFDFMKQPTRIEPSLVERTNAREAAKSYNAALRTIKMWNEKAGAPPDALARFSECVVD